MIVHDNVAWDFDINVDAEVYRDVDGILYSGVDIEIEIDYDENIEFKFEGGVDYFNDSSGNKYVKD